MKKPLQFQASSGSQRRDVTLLLLCSPTCCRESVAGSVNSSSSSQSVSKALKDRQRKGFGESVCMEASSVWFLYKGCSFLTSLPRMLDMFSRSLHNFRLEARFTKAFFFHDCPSDKMAVFLHYNIYIIYISEGGTDLGGGGCCIFPCLCPRQEGVHFAIFRLDLPSVL